MNVGVVYFKVSLNWKQYTCSSNAAEPGIAVILFYRYYKGLLISAFACMKRLVGPRDNIKLTAKYST